MLKKILFLSFIITLFFNSYCFAKTPSTKELDQYLSEHTLVIIKDNQIKFYDDKGIKPLITAIKNNELKDAYIADRIAGKAAALLYAYGGVKKVYIQVVSKPAIEVLKTNKIKYKYKTLTDNIVNRTHTGLCPMEMKVLNIDEPQKAWEIFSH